MFQDFCANLPPLGREALILAEVLPCIKELVQDSHQHVKTALASSIMGLAPIMGREQYLKNR